MFLGSVRGDLEGLNAEDEGEARRRRPTPAGRHLVDPRPPVEPGNVPRYAALPEGGLALAEEPPVGVVGRAPRELDGLPNLQHDTIAV